LLHGTVRREEVETSEKYHYINNALNEVLEKK
jgi:hypothetical protein